MKNLIASIILGLLMISSIVSFAQETEIVKLNQTPGKFETTELTLKAGQPYVFEVTNKGVDHKVGFVVAPEGKTDQTNHIQSAYLTKTVKNGESAKSKVVTLEKGEYVYFCPMNPTPQYKILVE
ncbi:MAG: cupredoxin domain-containing protein [Bacteroidota bacterium]